MKLPVNETFYSWQGEGCHMGRPAYFIRLQGCPVHCPWCDSAGTWKPGEIPASIPRSDPETLANQAAASPCAFVVITGGEPTIHDLAPLTAALRARNLPAHLETCGAFPLRGDFSWVTVSPKWAKPPLPETLARADELKLIVEDATSIPRWLDYLAPHLRPKLPLWLQPEWSQRQNPTVLNAISQAVRAGGLDLRAGWQLHKLYGVD